MDWKTLLADITGSVAQHLLLCNEYLVTENRMLRRQFKGRVRLRDGERKTLAELGQKLGKQALQEVATIVNPTPFLPGPAGSSPRNIGEASLRYVLAQYVEHFHHERHRQGKGNVLLFPTFSQDSKDEGAIQCRERLGGLLQYYVRKAA